MLLFYLRVHVNVVLPSTSAYTNGGTGEFYTGLVKLNLQR